MNSVALIALWTFLYHVMIFSVVHGVEFRRQTCAAIALALWRVSRKSKNKNIGTFHRVNFLKECLIIDGRGNPLQDWVMGCISAQNVMCPAPVLVTTHQEYNRFSRWILCERNILRFAWWQVCSCCQSLPEISISIYRLKTTALTWFSTESKKVKPNRKNNSINQPINVTMFFKKNELKNWSYALNGLHKFPLDDRSLN